MRKFGTRTVLVGGILFQLLAGAALHFVYGWLPSPFTALFAAVNESVWEHSRLVSIPMLVASLWEYPLCDRRKQFPFARAGGCWAGTLAVPTLFFTYSGIVGENALWADILVFIAAVLSGVFVFRLLLQYEWVGRRSYRLIGAGLLLLLAILDVVWTFAPPQLGLFRDPVSGLYGLG